MRELAHDALLSARAFGRGYFKRDFIEDLFRKHEATIPPTTAIRSGLSWRLELWHRQFVDEPRRWPYEGGRDSERGMHCWP